MTIVIIYIWTIINIAVFIAFMTASWHLGKIYIVISRIY